MKKIVLLFLLLVFILTGCKQTNSKGDTSSQSNNMEATDSTANSTNISFYESILDDLKNNSSDLYYFIKDIDGDGINDLIVHENTKLSFYTYEKTVKFIGENDFLTGTVRFFNSDNINYPGVFYFTVSGGMNHYGYLTIKDNKIQKEKLWTEDYSGVNGKKGEVTHISKNQGLIEESKKLYQNNKDIKFIIIEDKSNSSTNM